MQVTFVSTISCHGHRFSSISASNGIFDGTIGALDGWLCCTCQPIDKTIVNKRDYYSGHYQKFGLNVQAVCDAKQRFIYFGVAAPGKTNDARAVRKCVSLQQFLVSIKDSPYFLIGDNAYVLSDELLIPFSGNNAAIEQNRTYNFFLSQMRIRIEMAFGLLTTKWRIFRRDLTYSLRKNSQICQAAARLHNYVINERERLRMDGMDEIDTFLGAPRSLGYLPRHPEDADETIGDNNNDEWDTVPSGFSARRAVFVDHLRQYGLRRPERNVLRNG